MRTVTCVPDRDNLTAIANLLESGVVTPVIDTTYPLADTAAAVAHMLGHHARGNVAIAV